MEGPFDSGGGAQGVVSDPVPYRTGAVYVPHALGTFLAEETLRTTGQKNKIALLAKYVRQDVRSRRIYVTVFPSALNPQLGTCLSFVPEALCFVSLGWRFF